MRISYSYEEDFGGELALWQANCKRSLLGKKGQAVLRELEAALLAMPEKRLCDGSLVDNGEVCAVGALLTERRIRRGLTRTEALAEVESLAFDIGGGYRRSDDVFDDGRSRGRFEAKVHVRSLLVGEQEGK